MSLKNVLINFSDELNTAIPTLPNIIKVLKKQLLIVADNLGGDEPTGIKQIYTAKESAYTSDTANVPQYLDDYTEGAEFNDYLATLDHKSFSVITDCVCLVTIGVKQAQSSGNKPDTAFFVNDIITLNVTDPSTAVNSEMFVSAVIPLTAGDVIYFGSKTTSGYSLRCGQIDVISDLVGYVKPSYD